MATAKSVKKPVFGYVLGKLHKALVFQVVEESAIPADATPQKIQGIIIDRCSHPEVRLSENVIFLRGTNNEGHFRVDVENFDSNEERDESFDKIIAIFKEWGEKNEITIS
jgi:hypothetical protein